MRVATPSRVRTASSTRRPSRPCPSQESLYTLARAISDFMLAHMLHLTKLALPGRAFVKRLRRRVEHADETDL